MEGRCSGGQAHVRAFVSIHLPEAARDAIRPTLLALAAADIRGLRPVPERSAHITVRFLGAVPRAGIGRIRAALAAAGGQSAPFRLRIGDVGAFPERGPPSVLWVGLGGDLAAASGLRSAVDRALGPIAPPDGGRGLVPHVTLARLGRRAGGAERRRALEVARAFPPRAAGFEVGAISLVQSNLGPSGAEHVALGWFGLGRRGGDA